MVDNSELRGGSGLNVTTGGPRTERKWVHLVVPSEPVASHVPNSPCKDDPDREDGSDEWASALRGVSRVRSGLG